MSFLKIISQIYTNNAAALIPNLINPVQANCAKASNEQILAIIYKNLQISLYSTMPFIFYRITSKD